MKELSESKLYTEFQSKGFGDVFGFCDVMNYHLVSSTWKNGVALIDMTGDTSGIYNGHNKKFYLFNRINTPKGWVRNQFDKCADKYKCDNYTATKIRDDADVEVEEILEAMRRADY